ncbi:hypothetical protein CIHG_05881 [Coccidioides immitis H538.4]|uniref:Uncharacterized protein n=3 Tax=Coccidioides immitis TaxID=5501 RepID=A0A0J8RBW0_COCIT|nr:hypothetical protein CIRG_01943 [Coccidioides immitis RMSCC 2394]KMU81915.1 hypothetical protein CISG_09383 [Coccidioides immitis RMSCC 3703]KMU88113.1 hypothetical protein CIHG_05881 [Coccidioides immitis H538.4]
MDSKNFNVSKQQLSFLKEKKGKSRLILSPSINDKESKGTPASAWPVKGSIAHHHSLFQKGTPQKRKNQGEALLSFNPTAKAAWRIRVLFWRNDVAGWLSGRSCEPPDASLASYIIL